MIYLELYGSTKRRIRSLLAIVCGRNKALLPVYTQEMKFIQGGGTGKGGGGGMKKNAGVATQHVADRLE